LRGYSLFRVKGCWLEVELRTEDYAAGIEAAGVLPEGAGDLTVQGIETGRGIDAGEVGVVEEVVELEAQLQALRVSLANRDVLDDREIPDLLAGAADDVFGGVADAEFRTCGRGEGGSVEVAELCTFALGEDRVLEDVDAAVEAGTGSADKVCATDEVVADTEGCA